MYNYQILGVAFGIFMIGIILLFLRAGMLREKYSLVWMLLGVFIIILSLFRGLLEGLASLAGIEYAPSALFAVFMGSSFILLLNISISISHLKNTSKNLVQALGLLEERCRQLEKAVGNRNSETDPDPKRTRTRNSETDPDPAGLNEQNNNIF